MKGAKMGEHLQRNSAEFALYNSQAKWWAWAEAHSQTVSTSLISVCHAVLSLAHVQTNLQLRYQEPATTVQ